MGNVNNAAEMNSDQQ